MLQAITSALASVSERMLLMFRSLLLFLVIVSAEVSAGDTYYTQQQIQADVFGGEAISSGVIWLTPERKQAIYEVTGQSLTQARIRFQEGAGRRLWVLSEIGKEKPITFAVITATGEIERMEVMVFREVRGDEIRLPQYTAQYQGQVLTADGDLSQPVDGISGATYSVRSMKKVAKLALLLDSWVTQEHASAP